MNFEKLTSKSTEVLRHAEMLAREAGHPQIEPIHLLAAMLSVSESLMRPIVEGVGLDYHEAQNEVSATLSSLPKLSMGNSATAPSQALIRILTGASTEAEDRKSVV